jgi:hypothetical protein
MENVHKVKLGSQCLKKHVATIHINGVLSLVERKLANVLLLNAYDDLLTKQTHTLPVTHLLAMMGWEESNNIGRLQDAIKKLAGTSVEFNLMNDGKVSWHAMAMISYGSIEGGICTYSYAEFLSKQLYNPEIYATINLGIQRLFESGYALALYENCLRYKSVGSTGWWSVKKFRELVGATKNSYDEFKYLRREAIEKPVSEINRISDIRIAPEFRRQGRKIAEIRFVISQVPQQTALKSSVKDTHAGTRESDLFKKLRSHGIGERLAIAWILQDEGRARATVEYVEAKARKSQVKGSTAGYIRSLFEGGAEVGQPTFDIEMKEQARIAAESQRREEFEKRKILNEKNEAIERAKEIVLALSDEARLDFAAEYRKGYGADKSSSWDEGKGIFRNTLEKIQFTIWIQKQIIKAEKLNCTSSSNALK